jgi:MoxR-like ATPase
MAVAEAFPAAPVAPATIPGNATPGTATAAALFGVAGDLPVVTLPGGKPLDRHYLFRADQLMPLIAAFNAGLHVWLYGPPGTGKSTLAREIAARTGRPFFRINFADGIDRGDLIGQDTLAAGDITFRAGAMLTALQTPFAIILLDEVSFARPEDLPCLHPILDGSGAAIIPQTGATIVAAEGVSIIVANNTRGDIDKGGMYAGLRAMNEAFRDRFGVFIPVEHLTVAQESRLLRKRVPSLDKPTSIALATVVHASRELARKEEFPQAAISHRAAMAWALIMAQGVKARDAFDCTVASRHDPEVGEALAALFVKNFVPEAASASPEVSATTEENDNA